MTIRCKGVLLNRLIVLMIVIGGALMLALILLVIGDWDYLSIYTLTIAILSPMFFLIFYLNRFELLVIGIEDQNVYMSFINNSIFKRKDIKILKENLDVKQEGDKILFSINNELQAILRKDAVTKSDWDRVFQVFINP